MKLINSILEALFIPKPNDHLKRDYTQTDNYGRGLIFIPIPERTNLQQRILDSKKK